jgi:hypothetical protein
MSATCVVSISETAKKLGFAVGEGDAVAFRVDEDGTLEVPRWRHAIINFPHPLLEQGLVILDTPGLNAIGTEPELTLSLLPNAHAVLFILAADTGVTQSDLTVWQEHIGAPGGRKKGRIVVLNKIDSLWDELKSPAEVAAEIARQVDTCAWTLDLPAARSFLSRPRKHWLPRSTMTPTCSDGVVWASLNMLFPRN